MKNQSIKATVSFVVKHPTIIIPKLTLIIENYYFFFNDFSIFYNRANGSEIMNFQHYALLRFPYRQIVLAPLYLFQKETALCSAEVIDDIRDATASTTIGACYACLCPTTRG